MAELSDYYDLIQWGPDIPALVQDEPHPRFFPYPTEFDEYLATNTGSGPNHIKFEYIDAFRGDPTDVTFLAKVISPSDRKLVIKFVDRYGVEAHQLLADAGMAPRLLYCGLLDGKNDAREVKSHALSSTKCGGLYVGPMRMVVMEHFEGRAADGEKDTWPKDLRNKVEKAIKKLHDAGLVFGDLRGPNIMFSGEKAAIIDFDWAGREGEVRYPRHLSRSVRWPGSVEELEMKPHPEGSRLIHARPALSQVATPLE